ncbi:MAG: 16S rRNA (uracil(1498)-N(3))-methyltransferase [Bacteroidota bacterium]|nr:16S rRNA (uracil(1498)-N(3))-methyltransferase [Bacteroidota bacterium]
MSIPYFFEQNISGISSQITVSEETSKHCVQVLRMKEGDVLQLTDGKGQLFKASILHPDKRATIVLIDAVSIQTASPQKIAVCLSLLKNTSRFEWFLEKATEIGVGCIQPMISARTEHTRFRMDRMKGIVQAAMLQSQQAWLPELHEPVSFRQLVSESDYSQKLIAHCENETKNTISQVKSASHPNCQILIGPEGDFTQEEIQLALKNGYQPVSLGNTRLRAETAAVVASSLLVID